MPKPWEFDPDDPLSERPAAMWWRVLTIAVPIVLFVAALVLALVSAHTLIEVGGRPAVSPN